MKISIRTLLTVPFLIQLFVVAIFIGLFSYKSGQKSVEEVIGKLRDETSERVYQRIQLYLTTPHLVNQLNLTAYEQGLLTLEDPASLEKYFWNQLNTFHSVGESKSALNASVNNIYMGIADGRLYGAEYDSEAAQIYIMRADASTKNRLHLYVPDGEGNATPEKKIKNENEYNLQQRPWYDGALEKGEKSSWSQIYGDFTAKGGVITAVHAVYENGKPIAVFASDLLFEDVNEFLNSLDISPQGRVFLSDRNGKLLGFSTKGLATSASPKPRQNASETPVQSNPSATPQGEKPNTSPTVQEEQNLPEIGNSGDSLVDSTEKCLEQHSYVLGDVQEALSLECQPDHGERYFLQASPIEDKYGLDWLIFVAIPESDFMGQIRKNNIRTGIVSLVALLVAAGLGLLTSRWLAKPILKLKDSASLLADSVNKDIPEIKVSNPSELESLAITFQMMAKQLKASFEKQIQLNSSYSRFVPNKFVEILGKDITEVQLGDSNEQARMSILFSDIRSFTSLSEGMEPKENFDFINAYLRRMEPAITRNNGFIDKFIGDAIMALFTDPLQQDQDGEDQTLSSQAKADRLTSADHAVLAGIAMLEELDKYNKTRTSEHRKPIKIGIGINTGRMMLGTVGGDSRMDGTVISDEVNLASRLEGLTKRFGINLLVGEKTLNSLHERDQYHYRFLGSVRVKGRSEPVAIYEIFDGEPTDILMRKVQSKEIFEKAISLYQNRNFVEAKNCFEAALQIYSEDKSAQFYIERCANFERYGVPEGWTGIEDFDEK